MLCLVCLCVSMGSMELSRVANSVIWEKKKSCVSEPRTATDRMCTDARCKWSLFNGESWTHSNHSLISSYCTPLFWTRQTLRKLWPVSDSWYVWQVMSSSVWPAAGIIVLTCVYRAFMDSFAFGKIADFLLLRQTLMWSVSSVCSWSQDAAGHRPCFKSCWRVTSQIFSQI